MNQRTKRSFTLGLPLLAILLLACVLTGCEDDGVAPSSSAAQAASGSERRALNEQLFAAAERGDSSRVAQLADAGAELNATDAQGRTPLMIAVHADRLDVFRLLLERGANVNIRDHRSDNPLLYAGAEGKLDFLKAAIAAGADTKLTNRFGGTALIPAADRGHVEIVRELLTTSDVNVNHVNHLGWTALLEAILLGDGGPDHQAIVRLLLEHGADAQLADADGVTPLAHAKTRKYGDIAALLEAAGAK